MLAVNTHICLLKESHNNKDIIVIIFVQSCLLTLK